MNEPSWLRVIAFHVEDEDDDDDDDDLSGLSSSIIALIVYASIRIQVLLVYS